MKTITTQTITETLMQEVQKVIDGKSDIKQLKVVTGACAQAVYALRLPLENKRIETKLGEITGEITTNEILGNIFSKFCIGK